MMEDIPPSRLVSARLCCRFNHFLSMCLSNLEIARYQRDDDALQHIYRATVVARLTYAVSAWRGLIKAPDRKRIDSVLDRARHHGYTARQKTCRRSKSCVTLLMMNFLAELCDCLTMSYPRTNTCSILCIPAEIQSSTSHTRTTAAITHHTLVRFQLHYTNAL